jgi:hypothetical protein
VLLAGVAALALPALSGALAGCAEKPPDPLVALVVQARGDAALADAAAQALRSGSATPGAGSGSGSAAPGAGSGSTAPGAGSGPAASGSGSAASGSGSAASGSGSANGVKADVLTALAAARRAHATAMATELGDDAPPAPPADQPAPPAPQARNAVAAVLAALDESQRRAAAEVPGLPRQRASLVGSIAACCAAYRTVLT